MTRAVESRAAPVASGLVSLDGVTLTLGAREVLRGISLRLGERRVGVIGRNGSGKTSLARVLTGLITPETGQVRVNGVDVARDRKGALREIGVIFQNPDHQIIFPTVAEELSFGPRQQGHDKAHARCIAQEALDRFGVGAWAERAVSELSQGQKHLVCLMAVLAMRPSVIVLDEPFTGLDHPTSRALRRYLAGLEEMVVHITHDLEALARYDRVIWLEEGRIGQDGAAEEVLADYRTAMDRIGEGTDAVTDLAG